MNEVGEIWLHFHSEFTKKERMFSVLEKGEWSGCVKPFFGAGFDVI